MQGIEKIKEIFHIPFTALSVIKAQKHSGYHGDNKRRCEKSVKPLRYKSKTCSKKNKPFLFILAHNSEHGKQNALYSIVNAQPDSRLIRNISKYKIHSPESSNGCNKDNSVFKDIIIIKAQKQTAKNYGAGKSKQDIQIKAHTAPRYNAFDDIYRLTDKCENENTKKILLSVTCVKTSFTDKEGKNRHSDSAYNAQKLNLGKQHIAYVVYEH